MSNSRERRREMRASFHTPVPSPDLRWLSTKQLRKGHKQEINLASARYVVMSWQRKKGYCVEWSRQRFWEGSQERLSTREYRSKINDARKLFAERARIMAVEFAIQTLELDRT